MCWESLGGVVDFCLCFLSFSAVLCDVVVLCTTKKPFVDTVSVVVVIAVSQ
jgi:hypothetical protein